MTALEDICHFHFVNLATISKAYFWACLCDYFVVGFLVKVVFSVGYLTSDHPDQAGYESLARVSEVQGVIASLAWLPASVSRV